ncbi:MAG: helix-turn-helix domain-containing protein [Galactobacter sp.]|uniref:helix-turn-helix domain-containing protein n=1 Tax=Galactobacter sp. TaxID=2676125 RepID=UPI0025C0DE3C|nr:helix-turn-helix domain-containing protein [Galactobacter sp.]
MRDVEAGEPSDADVDTIGVHCRLTELLEERGLAVTELSALVGVSPVNLSVLKNDRAKAIRFSTLVAICDVLECEIGDLLVLRRD